MRLRFLIIIFPLLLLVAKLKAEEPKVTPVDIDDDAPRTVLHYYDKHGNELKEPVMFLATLDTISKPRSAPPYPLYNGFSVGVNFGDALLMTLGRKYAGVDIHANISLHNWLFPTVEFGLGFAESKPDHRNFTYRNRPAPYFRVGLDYNFVYKSNPDYRFFVGLRAGFSSFKYSVDDVTINSPYWDESTQFSLTDLRSYSLWGEALAGLQVKIVGCFSLGWNVRYKFPFHTKGTAAGTPWYVPGFGAKDAPYGMAISAIFTFGTRPARTQLPDLSAPEPIDQTQNQEATLPERRPLPVKSSHKEDKDISTDTPAASSASSEPDSESANPEGNSSNRAIESVETNIATSEEGF